MTYTLRSHQQKAIDLLRGSFVSGNRCPVLQAPTGMGKTLIAIDIIKRVRDSGKSAIFIVDRITLIEQTSKEFDRHGIPHGIIQGDHYRQNSERVQIASVQTLVRRKNKPHADIVIVDEAHCMYKSLSRLITEEWNATKFIGLSATPFAKGMGKVYDDLIVVEDTKSLIKKGFLSDYDAYGPPSADLTGIKTVAGDYNKKQLAERVSTKKIIGDVVDTWLRLGENRQTVCFAVNVAHSESIVDEFIANGVTAAHIDAFTPSDERADILKRHDNGEIKILSNVGIATKGWDSPNTSCLVYARPTKSLMLHIQILGRVLRKSADGSRAVILDHGGNIERLGFPTDELPRKLCDGEHIDSDSISKEKEEKLPTPCPNCNFLKTAFQCPSCGYMPEKNHEIEAEEGELKRLNEERKKGEERSAWAGMCKQYAIEKGYKSGWAYHFYQKKYSGSPPESPPIPLTAEFRNYVKYTNIRKAKKNDNTERSGSFHSTPRKGYEYEEITASNGSKMTKVTKNGKFMCWAKRN